MRTIYTIIFIFSSLLFLYSCSKEEYNVLSVLRRDIDNSNCFVEGHGKFVSMFFFKTQDKTLIQVITFIDRPYHSYNDFYYKEDSSYIYVCSGFCEDFREKNNFKEWTDSINQMYVSNIDMCEMSDSINNLYNENYKNLEIRYFEYDGFHITKLDSINKEEKDSVTSQLNRFDIGYSIPDLIPNPPSPPLLNSDKEVCN